MKLAALLLAVLGTSCCHASDPVLPLNARGRHSFLEAINGLRANPPGVAPFPALKPVGYNLQVEAALVAYVNENGPEYFWQHVNKLPSPSTLPHGWQIWFRDNIYGDAGGTGIGVNVKNRIKQGKPCFNYKLCSTTKYSRFASCATPKTLEPGQVCCCL